MSANGTQQMFPKPPKRMKQPRKDDIRWRAELAEAQLAYHSTPLWWRMWHRITSRIKRETALTEWK